MLKNIKGRLRSIFSNVFSARKQGLISQLLTLTVTSIVTQTRHPGKYLDGLGVCRTGEGRARADAARASAIPARGPASCLVQRALPSSISCSVFRNCMAREKLCGRASLLRAVHPPVRYSEAGGGCGCLSLAPRNLFHLQSTLQVLINHALSPTRQQTGFISPSFTAVEAKAERFLALPEVRRTSSWVSWVTTPGPHPSDVHTAALSPFITDI